MDEGGGRVAAHISAKCRDIGISGRAACFPVFSFPADSLVHLVCAAARVLIIVTLSALPA